MKIALVHDSFTQLGGAERVVDALHELFPSAPVFTLVFDPKFKEKYKGWDIRTSGLQTLFLALGKLQYLLPLIPWGVDNLDFTGYDVVISSSSSWAKNIRVPKNCVHICYCHTPTRFLWSEPEYIKQEVSFLLRPLVRLLISKMRKWDFAGAQRVTKFIANSKEVQSRIKKYYNRDSTIVYPFIDTNFWKPSFLRRHSEGVHPTEESQYQDKEILRPSDALGVQDDANVRDYFLLAGRLQPHKQNNIIVEIFNELGLPLHIVGTGRQENYLRSIAKNNISFFGHISDEELREQYSGAKALIYPQLEDFGLMPLEAAACGTPTLALGQGGALETVIQGETGEFFGIQVARGLASTKIEDRGNAALYKDQIKQIILSWNPQKYSVDHLRQQAEKFSKEKFKSQILEVVNSK
jgi:glycosyltransferase involved in cell wall biosynthesis